MTTPNVPARKRSGADEDSLTEWFMLHRREVTWTVVALAIVFAGYWFYERSQSIKSQRAETAYFQARQSEAAGNLPLRSEERRAGKEWRARGAAEDGRV